MDSFWKLAAEAAEIQADGRFPGAHAPRHTYETRLRGLLPDEILRHMMGHRFAPMTEHYDQATPEEGARRIVGETRRIDEVWRKRQRRRHGCLLGNASSSGTDDDGQDAGGESPLETDFAPPRSPSHPDCGHMHKQQNTICWTARKKHPTASADAHLPLAPSRQLKTGCQSANLSSGAHVPAELADRIVVPEKASMAFARMLSGTPLTPLFVHGDALDVLPTLPADCLDCCVTSPPYWGKREYAEGGIGLEPSHDEYIQNLAAILLEVKRVLKPTGSLWLNIGDSYQNKGLLGIPWRVALHLTDVQGWVLRNSVIWHKVKGGPDNTGDRLRNIHENVFHFVKSARDYYYDSGAIRTNPQKAKVVNGAIVSATGVTGVRYRRQIELSASLSEEEKANAYAALEAMLDRIRKQEIADFRMVIRGQQRATHSDSVKVSGRAKELATRGFYFLLYHPDGSKPGDVWEIIPEDTQGREAHFAPYPEDLCRIPILATCPPDGVVLDPFVGTGTTTLVAFKLGRKSVGIDISADYLRAAEERCNLLI